MEQVKDSAGDRQPLVRVALAGLGDIGTTAHLPALSADSRVEVCAVVDVDEQRLSIVGAGLPEQVFRTTDLSAALAAERLRDLIRDGYFGSPLLIRIGFFGEPADPLGNPEHYARMVRDLEFAAPIVHEGAHFCDWLNLLLPGPERSTGGASRPTRHCRPRTSTAVRSGTRTILPS
jgi:predicted dehydrogenase